MFLSVPSFNLTLCLCWFHVCCRFAAAEMVQYFLELFRPFRNVKWLCVSEAFVSLVAGALGLVTGELAMVALL
jgi:hypothetical protein